MSKVERTRLEDELLTIKSEKDIHKALCVTDVYIKPANMAASFAYTVDSSVQSAISSDDLIVISFLEKTIAKTRAKSGVNSLDMTVVFFGRYFRCSIMESIEGQEYCCRRMPDSPKSMNQVGMPKVILRELAHPRLSGGGLVFICGKPGNGKTTSVASFIKYRLVKNGGMCITIEDPPEIPLHGVHGRGMCIQTAVSEAGFATSMKMSLRAYPTGQDAIMFVGEVRDAETAVEVLKASIDGRLVVTTLHAGSVIDGVKRFAALAFKTLGVGAYDLLASAFRIGIHQRLVKDERTGKVQLKANCLLNTTQVVNKIQNNEFLLLQNELCQQAISLNKNKEVSYHK